MKKIFLLLISLFTLNIHHALANKPLEITKMTETSKWGETSQIVFHFNQNVAQLSDMNRKTAPISITPEIPCMWRYIDATKLACEFEVFTSWGVNYKKPNPKTLLPATKYEIKVAKGAEFEGKTLAKDFTTNFTSSTPEIYNFRALEFAEVGIPVGTLFFNMPVKIDSIKEGVYFEAKGGKRYAIDATPIIGEMKKGEKDDQTSYIIAPLEKINEDVTLIVSDKVRPTVGNLTFARTEVTKLAAIPSFRFLGINCAVPQANKKYPEHKLLENGSFHTQECSPDNSITLVFTRPLKDASESRKINILANDTPAPLKEISGYDYRKANFFHSITGDNKEVSFSFPINRPIPNATYKISLESEEPGFLTKIGHWFVKGWYKILRFVGLSDTVPVFSNTATITDMFETPLESNIDITFKTGPSNYNNLSLKYITAVVEQDQEIDIPATLTNIEEMKIKYTAFTSSGKKSDEKIITPNLERDKAKTINLGAKDLLDGKAGLVSGGVATKPFEKEYLTDWQGKVRYQDFTLISTPYQAVVKIGFENSLVWVTDLKTGKPVSDAEITLYLDKTTNVAGNGTKLSSASTNKDGIAKLAGTREMDPKVDYFKSWIRYNTESPFLKVKKAGETVIMPLSPDFKIETSRTSNDSIYGGYSAMEAGSTLSAFGFTEQGIYKVGDTINYRILVREKTNSGPKLPKIRKYNFELNSPKGSSLEKKEITLDEFGSYSGSYKLTDSAEVGNYNIVLKANVGTKSDKYLYPLNITVADFTGARFKVSGKMDKPVYNKKDKELTLKVNAAFNTKGAYSNAPVSAKLDLHQQGFYPKEKFNDFKFWLDFSSYDNYSNPIQIGTAKDNTNAKGEASFTFDMPKTNTPFYYGTIRAQITVTDDRGGTISENVSSPYYGTTYFVGIKSENEFLTENKKSKFEFIVIDKDSKPIKDAEIKVSLIKNETKTARFKGPGSAYLTDTYTEEVTVDDCRIKSKVGVDMASCNLTPKSSGSYFILAETKDASGNPSRTRWDLYVQGKDYVPWRAEENYSLEIIPEQEKLLIGDEARFLVKNPYPGATALITIERDGIMESFSKTFNNSTPVISFPVKPEYEGGVYLGVTLATARVPGAKVEDGLDLGKPAFKFGYKKVNIESKESRVDVDVITDKKLYRPQEEVVLTVKNPTRETLSVTAIILNEEVLNLIHDYKHEYDPYPNFYGMKNFSMMNYSLLLRLIGAQKVETKGDTTGGDGGLADFGANNMRTNFKNSLLFKTVKLEPAEAEKFRIKLPDNLSGWRVLAVSASKDGKFGLSENRFDVNKNIELTPNMPNFVYEDDKVSAGFTVLNRTDSEQTINVRISDGKAVKNQEVKLAPFARESVFMEITAPSLPFGRYAKKHEITFTAEAKTKEDSDAMVHKLEVKKAIVPKSFASYGISTTTATEEIVIPETARPDYGEYSASVSATILSDLEGAFEYMREYPYPCFEQKLSRALTALFYDRLKPYLDPAFIWADAQSVIKSVISEARNYQALNGGFAYYVNQDQYSNYYLSAFAAYAFNIFEKSGYSVDKEISEKLNSYLLDMLKRGEKKDASFDDLPSARSLAIVALADKGLVSVDDYKRVSSLENLPTLAKIQLISAANKLGLKDEAKDLVQNFLDTARYDAGKISLPAGLFSKNHASCALLSAISEVDSEKSHRLIAANLARGVLSTRNAKGEFLGTQETIICLKSLSDYSANYEQTSSSISGSVKFAPLDAEKYSFENIRAKPENFAHEIKEGDAGRTVTVEFANSSPVYYTTRLTYAPRETKDLAAEANGFTIARSYYRKEENGEWKEISGSDKLKRGDEIKTELRLSVPATRQQVVVDDAIPSIFEPLNPILAGSGDAKVSTSYYFYHTEMRFDSMRFYAEYLPSGTYTLSYTSRVVGVGEAISLPAKVLEMYYPENYGASTSLKFESAQ